MPYDRDQGRSVSPDWTAAPNRRARPSDVHAAGSSGRDTDRCSTRERSLYAADGCGSIGTDASGSVRTSGTMDRVRFGDWFADGRGSIGTDASGSVDAVGAGDSVG